jgi:hypothetical protein
MDSPVFGAYYSEDIEIRFLAPGWPEAVTMALARVTEGTGRLEALELINPADLQAG